MFYVHQLNFSTYCQGNTAHRRRLQRIGSDYSARMSATPFTQTARLDLQGALRLHALHGRAGRGVGRAETLGTWLSQVRTLSLRKRTPVHAYHPGTCALVSTWEKGLNACAYVICIVLSCPS